MFKLLALTVSPAQSSRGKNHVLFPLLPAQDLPSYLVESTERVPVVVMDRSSQRGCCREELNFGVGHGLTELFFFLIVNYFF